MVEKSLMIDRRLHRERIVGLLRRFPVVALLGARQVGKTTLAKEIAASAGRVSHFDLERPSDVARLVDAQLALESLRANHLRIIDTLMESNTQLFANTTAWADEWKKTKLQNIALLLEAAIAAQGRVGLMLNVRRENLQTILGLLPSLQGPTISNLSDDQWVAVNTIIEEKTVRALIPQLKAAKAQGIVEYPLNKIVL